MAAVTDVHSWIAGGDRQVLPGTPALDANFGTLTSFAMRAKAEAALEGKDVFLVDNGDVVDGTGLSNVAADHCTDLLPLLSRMPFDALNCGNHELVSADGDATSHATSRFSMPHAVTDLCHGRSRAPRAAVYE